MQDAHQGDSGGEPQKQESAENQPSEQVSSTSSGGDEFPVEFVDEPAGGTFVSVTELTASASFSGPLPPPAILQRYNEIVPGSAERIIAMAEKQSEHRRLLESDLAAAEIADQKSERSERRLGQCFALVICVLGIVGGTIAAVSGAQTAGSVIGGGGLASVVIAFITGRLPSLSKSPRSKDESESHAK